METLPKITSCFGVIIESNQSPPRIYLVHNNADPLGSNGEERKPEGFGPPGGGGKSGETPFDTVKREVEDEIGIVTEIATYGKKSKIGEILFESKIVIETETGKPAINEIYIFHLKRINANGFVKIKETDETGRLMLATFGSILTMPLARKKIRNSDGSATIVENPEGIYFSARERFFGVAEYLGYDFYELIPNLDELFPKINQGEVGDYVFNLLNEAVEKKNEIRERRADRLRPDLDELLERYLEWAVR